MTAQAGSGPLLFHSSVERKPLFYILAAAAFVGPAVVLGVAVPYVWAQSRQTAYIIAAAATVDFLATWFVALIIRWMEVTFDGRRVRIGSRVFKTSVPVEDILAAEAVRPAGAGTATRPESREYIKLTTRTGVYSVPCVNAEALVELLHEYGGVAT
jgi:hypothetical protein